MVGSDRFRLKVCDLIVAVGGGSEAAILQERIIAAGGGGLPRRSYFDSFPVVLPNNYPICGNREPRGQQIS